MNRPRHRRRTPQRTGPIRNAGGVLRQGEPWQDPAGPGGDDAAASGVRAGYRVIDEQIRRGRRMAEKLDGEPRGQEEDPRRARRYQYQERRERRERQERRERRPWPGYQDQEPRSRYCEGPRYGGGPFQLLGMPLRQLERLVREILRQIGSARPDPWRLAGLLFELQIEAVAELARCGFGAFGMAAPRWEDRFDEDADRSGRDFEGRFGGIDDEDLEEDDLDDDDLEDEDLDDDDLDDEDLDDEPAEEAWAWPPAPSAPAVIRASVPIPVWVWSYERTEIDLELPPGAQSLDLEVESPRMTGTGEPPRPAFEAEFAALADGPVILRVEVPRELPAGRYLRRVLVRATGEPVGDLTVQVGTLPMTPAPGPKPSRARKQ
jgi:hypothetical protein